MATGFITTARGEVINMDDIKNNAMAPLIAQLQEKTEITKQVIPDINPIKVRGFVPMQGDAPTPINTPNIQNAIDQKVAAKVQTDTPISIAAITGVTIRNTESAVEREKRRRGLVNKTEALDTKNAAQEILSDLDKEPEAASVNSVKTTRRSRKKR